MIMREVCPECRGNLEIQQIEDHRDWVCVDCGSVVNSENLKLEEQESTNPQGDYEVEEL